MRCLNRLQNQYVDDNIEEKNETEEINFESDVTSMISLIKTDCSTYSNKFEKRFYLERNFDIKMEHVLCNENVFVNDRKEMIKLFRILSDDKQIFTCKKPLKCRIYQKFTPSTFALKNISLSFQCYDFDGNVKVSQKLLEKRKGNCKFILTHGYYLVYETKEGCKKRRKFPLMCASKTNIDKSQQTVGIAKLVYLSENTKILKFIVNLKIIQKTNDYPISVAERLKKCFHDTNDAVRRYNIPVPQCVGDNIIRKSNMAELCNLNLRNWKSFGYNLKTPNDITVYETMLQKTHNYVNFEDIENAYRGTTI